MKRLGQLLLLTLWCCCYFPCGAAAQYLSTYQPGTQLTLAVSDSDHYEIVSQGQDSVVVQVFDMRGKSVSGVTKDRVKIRTLDGIDATILSIDAIKIPHTQGLSLSFVLDNSSSMFSTYDSLTSILDQLLRHLPPGVIASVVTFDNTARTREHEFTNRKGLYIAPLRTTDQLSKVSNFWHYYDSIRSDFTPLYDAMSTSLRMIQDRKEAALTAASSSNTETDSSRVEVMIVVSDGQDNASLIPADLLRKYLEASGVTLYVVNYRTLPDRLLLWIMRRTRGENFYADNIFELRKALAEIQRELVAGYVIHYQFPMLRPLGSK